MIFISNNGEVQPPNYFLAIRINPKLVICIKTVLLITPQFMVQHKEQVRN